MILTLAWRTLLARPIRSAVLAAGFGLGVAVMAALLGIGEVILHQARAPALVGGGDAMITGGTGRVTSARFILSSVLGSSPLNERVAAASPSTRTRLFLVREDRTVPIVVRGGIPSLERAVRDSETAAVEAWTDAPSDAAWTNPEAEDVLRAMDRFHPIPDVPERARSWAEWLYFNARAGETKLYATFLVGPKVESGRRIAAVRLQLDRGGQLTNYSDTAEIDEAALLDEAPDLTIGKSHVRLVDRQYRLTFDLQAERGDARNGSQSGRTAADRVSGELVLEATPGRSVPPLSIRGAAGWVSGYVVPVMSGNISGHLRIGSDEVSLDGGTGYHDHNWGFWEGVSWQWGQVQGEGLSFVYGRVYPPKDAADASRIPGFLVVLGPNGPIGYATNVTITETGSTQSAVDRIVIRGRGEGVDVTMDLAVQDRVVTRMRPGLFGGGLDFFQLRGQYRVEGKAGDQEISFTSSGAAETFRGRSEP